MIVVKAPFTAFTLMTGTFVTQLAMFATVLFAIIICPIDEFVESDFAMDNKERIKA